MRHYQPSWPFVTALPTLCPLPPSLKFFPECSLYGIYYDPSYTKNPERTKYMTYFLQPLTSDEVHRKFSVIMSLA